MPGPSEGGREAVARTTSAPSTVASSTADLRRLGLPVGGTVLVHSSLRSLGWIVGEADAVALALEAAVGGEGTLMVPAHSMNAPDPSRWTGPPVPEI